MLIFVLFILHPADTYIILTIIQTNNVGYAWSRYLNYSSGEWKVCLILLFYFYQKKLYICSPSRNFIMSTAELIHLINKTYFYVLFYCYFELSRRRPLLCYAFFFSRQISLNLRIREFCAYCLKYFNPRKIIVS